MYIPPTPTPYTSWEIAYMITQPLMVVPVATDSMTAPSSMITASCMRGQSRVLRLSCLCRMNVNHKLAAQTRPARSCDLCCCCMQILAIAMQQRTYLAQYDRPPNVSNHAKFQFAECIACIQKLQQLAPREYCLLHQTVHCMLQRCDFGSLIDSSGLHKTVIFDKAIGMLHSRRVQVPIALHLDHTPTSPQPVPQEANQ